MEEIQIVRIFEIGKGTVSSRRYPTIKVTLNNPITVRDGNSFGLLNLYANLYHALNRCQTLSNKNKYLKERTDIGAEGCNGCEYLDSCLLRSTYIKVEKITDGEDPGK